MSDSDSGSGVLAEMEANLLSLAELVSLATWVEPGLLRRLRLDQLRSTDAGLEAELWFSPLVRVRNATGFALHAEARLQLRERLAAQPERLSIAWEQTRIAHAAAPPVVLLEEEITFLALSEPKIDKIDKIEEKLREVLAALVTQGRTGLAQWAAGALPLFPRCVRDTETAWLLAAAASQVLGGPPVFSEEPSGRMKPAHLRRVLGSGTTAFIGVRWLEEGLEFGPPDLPGAKLIQVPRVSPVLLDVLTVGRAETNSPAQSLSVAFNLGERKRIPWEKPPPPSVCILETERDRGTSDELRRALTAAGVDPNPGIGGGSVHLDRLEEYLAAGNPVPETEIATVLNVLGSQVWVVVLATPAWFETGRCQPALEAFLERTGGARVIAVLAGEGERFAEAFRGRPVRVIRGDLREGDTARRLLDILLPARGLPWEVWIETLLQERHVLRPLREGEAPNAAAVRLRERLTAPGPKRVLSLEGGGVRTASEFGYLARMEDLLRRRSGQVDFRLADYFDLIGGSSSGSVIAACLAQRMSVAEAEAVWHRFVAAVFSRRSGLLRQFQHRFEDGPLNRALAEVFGNRTLTDDALVTGLWFYLKRMDTGDTVALTNHPGSRHHVQRRTVMLRDALRAALAAPTLFAPVPLTLGTDTPGVYMDAAASVAADPAWHLFRMATSDRQPFRWPASAEDLLLVSVGAGHWTESKTAEEIVRGGILQWTGGLPNLLLRSARRQTGELLEAFGQPLTPSRTPLSDWFGDRPRLSLVRYSVALDADRLSELGLDDAARDAEALQAVDDASQAGMHQRIGRAAAERDVLEEHFPTQFDAMVRPPSQENAAGSGAPPPYVYLSYAAEDQDVAGGIVEQLSSEGIPTVRPETDLQAGTDWKAWTENAIGQCAVFVPLLSGHVRAPSEASPSFVSAECEIALESASRRPRKHAFIVPIRLDGADFKELSHLPRRIQEIHWGALHEGRLPPRVIALIHEALGAARLG
jgi:uncharacterized protein